MTDKYKAAFSATLRRTPRVGITVDDIQEKIDLAWAKIILWKESRETGYYCTVEIDRVLGALRALRLLRHSMRECVRVPAHFRGSISMTTHVVFKCQIHELRAWTGGKGVRSKYMQQDQHFQALVRWFFRDAVKSLRTYTGKGVIGALSEGKGHWPSNARIHWQRAKLDTTSTLGLN